MCRSNQTQIYTRQYIPASAIKRNLIHIHRQPYMPLSTAICYLFQLSDGAEVVKISKRFFLQNADNNTMLKVETMVCCHSNEITINKNTFYIKRFSLQSAHHLIISMFMSPFLINSTKNICLRRMPSKLCIIKRLGSNIKLLYGVV